MRKKILLFLLAVLLAFPSMAQDFEYEYEGQTVAYTVLDENAKTCTTREGDQESFKAGNKSIKGNLILPSNPKFNGTEYTLTKIGTLSFLYSGSMTSLEIPNTVTEIGESAFSMCSSLTEVSIPNSVTIIGGSAFYETKLTEITLPNSVTEIGIYAFGECSRLTKITIPNSVTEISDYTFYGCKSLTEVSIPNSVTKIGD